MTSLLSQTAVVTAIMLFFFLLPRAFSGVSRVSRHLLLVGTGGLLGFFFFDLIPEVIHEGGIKSVGLIVMAWGVYVLLQRIPGFSHSHEHETQHEHENRGPHAHSPWLLFGAMVVHCLASGALMAISGGHVFGAMVSHKAYEALSVSLVLRPKTRSWLGSLGTASVYAGVFPLGVWLTDRAVHAGLAENLAWGLSLESLALAIASLAVGSILGCLIHDFLIPSFLRLKSHPKDGIWLLMGLLVTFLVMHGAHGH